MSLFILIFSLLVCANAQEPVVISIQDEKVYAGDEFTVNVFISANSQVSGAVIDLNYNNEMLEFVSAKEGAILDMNGNISIRNINQDKSCVRFTYMSGSSGLNAEGIIFNVTFKALETVSGKTDIEIMIPNAADFVNDNLEKISYSVDNAEITILNNISIEATTELTTGESTSVLESITESLEDELSTNVTAEANDNNDDNNIVTMVVLLLIGFSLICFGLAAVAKKKKKK
jgi:hypothetical protein